MGRMSSSSTDSVTNKEKTQNGVADLLTISSNDGDRISTSSLDFLVKLNNAEPTHGLLVPSKKRTNSNFAYTMILQGHTYHVCYRRQTPRGERVYWRCQLRGQCKARLITDLDGKIVQFTNPNHSHSTSTRLNTQQQRCIQALLTTVEENIDFLNSTNSESLISPTLNPQSPSEENEPANPINFESPNTSSTISINGEVPESTKNTIKRKKNVTKSQQTGEINIEEVFRQIPQLQTLRFGSYYENINDDEDDEENTDDNFNHLTSTPNIKNAVGEDTVYENSDSSSVASPSHLSDSQRRQLFDALLHKGWSSQNNSRDSIQKTYEFMDFNEAFGFMNRIALKAEAIHRHPRWTNVYNQVQITLPANSTHRNQSLTTADLHLAKFMDEIYHH